MPQPPRLTIVLCVLDDAPAAETIDYLRRITRDGIRVLCLFTRYARIRDVLKARRHGFVFYRWDGTMANARVIARSIVGRSWILVLETGERIDGRLDHISSFLESQPLEVDEVTIPASDGTQRARLFHLRPQGEPSAKTVYSGLSLRLSRE